jgi:GH18 family chitinase
MALCVYNSAGIKGLIQTLRIDMNIIRLLWKKPGMILLATLSFLLLLSISPWQEEPEVAAPTLWVTSQREPYKPFTISGYLPDYEIYNIDEKSLEHLTDVIYFAVEPTDNGTITWNRIRDYHLEKLHAFQEKFGFKLHLGIADHSKRADNTGIRRIIQSPELRKTFAKNLAEILVSYQFDGADIDWEFPYGPEEAAGFTLLLKDIHQEFAPLGKTLSIAVSRYFPVENEAYQYVNQVNLMAYDEPGKHSTTENSMRNFDVVSGRQGASRHQVLLGVPFYGRGLSKGRTWGDAVTYKTLRQKYQVRPEQDLIDGYYFNGINTVTEKVDAAWDGGAGGVMIWQIGQDSDDEFSLLRTINSLVMEKERELLELNL